MPMNYGYSAAGKKKEMDSRKKKAPAKKMPKNKIAKKKM